MPQNSGDLFRRKAVNRALQCATMRNDMASLFGRCLTAAKVARLTKERDWLAAKLSDCPPEFTNCAVDCAECRKEAARRAVADSEVE